MEQRDHRTGNPTEQDASANSRNRNGRMEIGLGRGVRGYFDIDGITISVWGSAWTGREIVRVDDRVVSDKRSFRFTTPHHFEHAGVRYKLLFITGPIHRGEFRLELYREGELVDSDLCRAGAPWVEDDTGNFSWRRFALTMGPFFVGGLAAGALAAWFVDWLN